MQIFISGTGTDIGKTLVCSWICLHTKYAYFKPIQTGSAEGTDTETDTDTETVKKLSDTVTYKEAYSYEPPVSPHLAARLAGDRIDIDKINLPNQANLIVEGSGGVLVPINENSLVVDLMRLWNLPVIVVASTRLGTINHTLLTIEALRNRGISILGIIMSGETNEENSKAIEFYGNVEILAEIPLLRTITKEALEQIPLTKKLANILL